MRILAASQAEWVVIENVPGLLTSDRGRDFHTVLATLAELGYVDRAYRILDSRYFGVAQRRRRVFVVARRGTECGCAGAVLFESTSGGGNPAAGGEARADVAATLRGRSHGPGVNAPGRGGEDDASLVTAFNWYASGDMSVGRVSPTLKVSDGHAPAIAFDNRDAKHDTAVGTLRADCHGANPMIAAYQCHGSNVGPIGTLRAGNGNEHGGVPFVAHSLTSSMGHHGHSSPRGDGSDNLVAPAVTSKWAKGTGGPAGDECQNLAPNHAQGVRRLTPLECERLQGFPDGWTCLCPAQGDTATCVCPDSPRYKQMGNAVTVSVIRWIAARLRAGAQRQQEGAA